MNEELRTGKTNMTYIYRYISPLGIITMASDGKALSGLWFDGQKHFAATVGDDTDEKKLPVFEEVVKWLDIYFGGSVPRFTPPLLLSGSVFGRGVYEELLNVSYGRTITYGELAAKIAVKFAKTRVAARAVGNAVSRNPVALIVPCHRVIGAKGNLVGYAGGIERKRYLLQLESMIRL